ncbi:AroA2 [Paenibacillus mucilaginosus 3016]|uniref:3-phosphoshikimate 1-carboxyvinyltransferase n=1 Tax=Paenibacillus mucilaginosus 3016 TaxID=1116391 RepID=H6NA94_9BACL|nr:3-phosphoshikimate 1-carboxyvinyltransferase [Paenibacillus mucilaginosus]AFC29340.1 AroA2 [Paenibacillus mucilaginosus 3016]WFA18057.1 3-phosphoshikimate 1-carboxyvinyltransferase [Paenibacillus mucilaginosus]
MVMGQPDLEARSPWSANNDKPQVEIHPPVGAVNGSLRVPGSKSLTNRALVIAALAEGRSAIHGILKSDDSYWCMDALKKLGVGVTIEGETAYIEGCGGKWPNPSGELYVGAAGTVARFLPAALAAGTGEWTLRGSRRMSERPLAPLLRALTSLGTRFQYGEKELCLPLTLQADGLQGGEVTLPGSTSSQFISGLLLAAPYAKEPLTLRIEGEVVQRDYVRMTLDTMAAFGIRPEVSADGQSIAVPRGCYQARAFQLEPDVSTCGYFWALAALTAGRVRIEGIDAKNTTQPDIEILEVLERMGCTVLRGGDFVEVQGTERLKGGFTMSMRKSSDQTLTIAALAPFADGPITLTDAAHIRHHECDRISAICAELSKLGIRVDEHHDGLTVYPGRPVPALLDSHDDHRMAMALSLIGLKAGGIRISDPGCVSKTCPGYFDQLSRLGVRIEY